MLLILLLCIIVGIFLYKFLIETPSTSSSVKKMKSWNKIINEPAEIDGKFLFIKKNNEVKKITNYQILALFLISLNNHSGFNELISDELYIRLNNLFEECYKNNTNYIEKAILLINEKDIMDYYYGNVETFGDNEAKLNKPLFAAGVISYNIDDKDIASKYEYLVKLLYNKDPIYLTYACETFINLNKNISLSKMLFNIDYQSDITSITTTTSIPLTTTSIPPTTTTSIPPTTTTNIPPTTTINVQPTTTNIPLEMNDVIDIVVQDIDSVTLLVGLTNQTTSATVKMIQTTTAPRTIAQTTTAPRTIAQTTTAPRAIAQTTTAPRTIAQTTTAPRIIAQTTTAPRIIAQTTTAPRIIAQTTTAPITIAQTTAAPRTIAQTTTAPRTIAQTTAAPITAAPITAAPITIAQTTTAPRTIAQTTTAPRTIAQTTTGIVNNVSLQNFNNGIKLGGL